MTDDSDADRGRDAAGADRRIDPDSERLLLDAMLGKLATYLRMCGYDAAYALDRGVEDDDRLREIAASEDRLLLTRDAELARRAERSLLLERREIADQLRELDAAGVALALDDRPSRCGACNGPVERVPAGDPTPAYAPDPAEVGVWRCRDCGQYLWKGSHWADVRERLARIAER